MDELLSRKEVLDLWDKFHPYIATYAMQFDEKLRELKPVEPQRIRCKDCKHFIREDREEYTPYGFYNTYFDAFCDKHWDNEQGEYINVKLDDFCSFAEKREATT